MRCLTLAGRLAERGAVVQFIMASAPPEIIDLVQQSGHQVCMLKAPEEITSHRTDEHILPHAHWLTVPWQVDAAQTSEVLQQTGGNHLLIVDHYALDYRWQQMMRDQTKSIAVIDDLADRQHDCDFLIDQTLGRTATDYERLVPPGAKLLPGTDFCLLRPEFAEKRPASLLRRQAPCPARRILVNIGTTDPDRLVPKILAGLIRACPQAEIDVVIGTADPDDRDLVRLVEESNGRIHVHGFSRHMADLMTRADLAIGAGGSTSWERCCLGLPTIMVVVAENQARIGKELEQTGAVQVLPVALCDDAEHLQSVFKSLANNGELLQKMSLAAANICDGQGAQRVADVLTR